MGLFSKSRPNSDHYAYTPDLQDPASWRLPLRDSAGNYDPKRVAAALGALSPDAQPAIPPRMHRACRAKVAAAYKAIHGSDAALPDILRKADLFAPAPLDEDGAPRGVMIALVPDAATARAVALSDDGAMPPEELHVTVLYLGDLGWMTPQDIEDLPAVVRSFVHREGLGPLPCDVTGWAVFDGDDPEQAPAVALINCPGLSDLREDLCEYLAEAGYMTWGDYAYVPHMTLGYGPWLSEGRLPTPTSASFTADALIVCWAGQTERVALDGNVALDRGLGLVSPDEYGVDAAWVAKDDAKRYTLSPLYVPAALDSHGEFATAEDLEAAVWDYMDRGSFNINYEHMGLTHAGRCVGIICWPMEVTATLTNGKGETESVTLPPGTVYQSVIWDDWAWPLVLDGRINALSLEGFARKVPAPA